MIEHLTQNNIFAVADFFFTFTFDFSIFLQGISSIGKSNFHFHRTVASLAAVSFVNDNGKVFLFAFVNFGKNHWKFLQSSNNNADIVVDGVFQILRGHLVIDQFDHTFFVLKTFNSCLQLGIKDFAVSNDNNGTVNGGVFCIVQTGEAVSGPGDAVGLA